ncbi:MAG: hypothetical protein JWN72_2350 [Thermoleophilia bacterium]|nr:hypothetical protein [Thermoleophilia bacterium]
MIGGLLLDLCVVAAIVLFGWAGGLLGGVASIGRTIAAYVAFVVAALMCDPSGDVVHALTGLGAETSRIVGAGLCGAIVWLAMAAVLRWWLARRAAGRIDPEWDVPLEDPLERRGVAVVSGALFGLGWVTLFVAMLVMLPGDNFVSRAAVGSTSGAALIRQEGVLQWLDARFPHYTQTLPKGERGAVVGNAGSLPMRGAGVARAATADADQLLRSVNAIRRGRSLEVLEPNRAIARVAQRQAEALAQDHQLSTRVAGGATLDAQVQAALGGDATLYEEHASVLVVWAHTPGNALAGLKSKTATNDQLVDPDAAGVGIGAADAGWFNGRIYVIVLVQPVEEDAAAGSDERVVTDDLGSADAAAGDTASSTDVQGRTGEGINGALDPDDVDGDGDVDGDDAARAAELAAGADPDATRADGRN